MHPGRFAALISAIALAGGTALAVAGCKTTPPEPPPKPEGWQTLYEDDDALYLSAWGSADDDVWVAGGSADSTRVLHYDGLAVTEVDTGGDRLAWWVFGIDDQVIVVGDAGLILRRDPAGAWSDESVPLPEALFGVWGTGADNLWAVGGAFPLGRAVLLHNDGTGWRQIPLPVPARDRRALFKVWGTSRDDVYAVGEVGTVVHFDGVQWRVMPTPDNSDLLTVHGTGPTDVWAVGGRVAPVVWHFEGAVWRDVTPAGLDTFGLNGVHAGAGIATQIVGRPGYHLEFDGAVWNQPEPQTDELLHAVWCGGICVAVGGNLLEYPAPSRGVVLLIDPAPAVVDEPCGAPPSCGDGLTTCGEECDDGNRLDGDYCNWTCEAVTGECGDGVWQMHEACDDGDTDDCTTPCNGSCTGPSNVCGDGEQRCGEGCDDGNGDLNDACPDGPAGTCEPASCGDGHAWAGNEQCDGTDLLGENCRLFMFPGPGLLQCNNCLFDTSMCGAVCGDGMMGAGETCDDGNMDNTDGCPDGALGTCRNARCGDGFVHAGVETCDAGPTPACGGPCSDTCDGPAPPCPAPACEPDAMRWLEVGTGTMTFTPLDAMGNVPVEMGPQGITMLQLSLRGEGFLPGSGPTDRPHLDLRLYDGGDVQVGGLSLNIAFTGGPPAEVVGLFMPFDPAVIGVPHRLEVGLVDDGGTEICLTVTVVPQ